MLTNILIVNEAFDNKSKDFERYSSFTQNEICVTYHFLTFRLFNIPVM